MRKRILSILLTLCMVLRRVYHIFDRVTGGI